MEIQFLGQGYEPESENAVGKRLIHFFSRKDFNAFWGISAFTSVRGIEGLSKHIEVAKKHLKSITIITGVDLNGTSKEALIALLGLGINSYVFYQETSSIYHPKIYLFEGKKKSALIIGSSNLTTSGLFTNVEASILINIDSTLASDRKVIAKLKDYFKGLFDYTDPNLKPITFELINQLVAENIVPTETEQRAMRAKFIKKEKQSTASLISKIFPKRKIPRVPDEFKVKSISKKASEKDVTLNPIIRRIPSELLWMSGPLTERDLNIPKGSNTHYTGSMLFKKGKTKGIDQRHYFRDTVFSTLNWVPDSLSEKSHLERSIALFNLIIEGNDYGDFELTLTHNTNKDSRSYKQKNSMTSIRWGAAKGLIAREELIGKSVSLYRNKGEQDEYTMVIG